MKNPLSTFVIATSGNFGKVKQTDIQRWVEKAGGLSAPQIDKNTTHLVCSWEDYRAKVPKVKQALRNRKIHIVTYDWLEDALQKRRAGKERGKYLLANVEKQKRREEKAITRSIKKVDKRIRKRLKKDGDPSGEAFAYLGDWIEKRRRRSMDEYALEMGIGTHHIYKDETGFEYNVCLARVVDIRANKNDFFHLKIYESNALPHLYAALARYRRPGASAVEILAPVGSFFDEAFAKFRRHFERKTGVKWENRLDAAAAKEEEGGGAAAGAAMEGRYFYRPPPATGRKGRGVLPADKTALLAHAAAAKKADQTSTTTITPHSQGLPAERDSESSDQSPEEESQSGDGEEEEEGVEAEEEEEEGEEEEEEVDEEEEEEEENTPKSRFPEATDSFYTWHESYVTY